MEKIKKSLFVLLLLLVSLTASAFMVLEAGHFYQGLYTNSAFGSMGYVAAGLNEVFMAIMAAVWLPGRTKAKGHPVNYLFRFLVVLLFVTTVGGACFNAIETHLEKIALQDNNQEILSVLRSQVADHEKSLKTFVVQHQPVNSAITVRNQVATKQKLIEALQQKQSVGGLWTEVFFLVVLRFAVQLANLTCVWLIGWVWRRQEFTPARAVQSASVVQPVAETVKASRPTPFDLLTAPKTTEPVVPTRGLSAAAKMDDLKAPELKTAEPSKPAVQTNPEAVPAASPVAQPTVAPQTQAAALAQKPSVSAPVTTPVQPATSAPVENSMPAAVAKTAPVANATPEPSVQAEPRVTTQDLNSTQENSRNVTASNPETAETQTIIPSQDAEVLAKQEEPLTSPEAQTEAPAPKRPAVKKATPTAQKKKAITKSNTIPFPKVVVPPRPVAEPEEEEFTENTEELRREIRQLVEQRNPGVTLSNFCGVINQRPEDIKDICNLRQDITPAQADKLERILLSIQALQQDEWAVGC